jgi:hypothetical protein
LIDLREIKAFARQGMLGTTFFGVISSEPDELSEEQFLSKVSLYFAILKAEETAPQAQLSAQYSNPWKVTLSVGKMRNKR